MGCPILAQQGWGTDQPEPLARACGPPRAGVPHPCAAGCPVLRVLSKGGGRINQSRWQDLSALGGACGPPRLLECPILAQQGWGTDQSHDHPRPVPIYSCGTPHLRQVPMPNPRTYYSGTSFRRVGITGGNLPKIKPIDLKALAEDAAGLD